MATLYWGDRNNIPDGNWNNASNWWLTLGEYCNCCGSTSGTPAGRIPANGDTVVLVGGQNRSTLILVGDITTGPTTPVNAPISWYVNPVYYQGVRIAAGSYAQNVTIGSTAAPAIITNYPPSPFGISGGSFSGAVSLNYAVTTFYYPSIPAISGGTFTGTVTRLPAKFGVGNGVNTPAYNVISGGTYLPTATCALSGSVLVDTNLPNDPGFAAAGGTYSPIINVTGGGGGSGQYLHVAEFSGLAAADQTTNILAASADAFLTAYELSPALTPSLSPNFQPNTRYLRLTAGANCSIAIGADPVAAVGGWFLDANVDAEYWVRVPPGSGYKLSCIADSA